MATATVSPNQSIDFSTLDLSDGSTDAPTSTSIRRTVDTDNFHDFFGTDFTYDVGGNITGGTLTGITDTFGGTTRLTVTGLSVPATDLQAYFDGHDTAASVRPLGDGVSLLVTTTVGSTIVAIPWAASARNLSPAPATRASSLPHSCG